MQNFTGLYKKSSAGIRCALGIFFLSSISFASEAVPLTQSQPAPAVTLASERVVQEPTAQNTTSSVVSSPANTSKPIASPQKVSSASQLANLMGGLALIVVLIYGLSWFVKRFTQGGFMQNPSMKIVSAMPLGTRERLMLVDVGGKQLLLGVTATQINTLHVFDEPVVPAEKPQPVTSDFSQKLMAILQQKNFTPIDAAAHKK
jgi:flagellar protein FliO/FliZ